jgi:hypothetical protein
MRPSQVFCVFLLGGIAVSFVLGAVALAVLLAIIMVGAIILSMVGAFFRAQRDAASDALSQANKDKSAKTNGSA